VVSLLRRKPKFGSAWGLLGDLLGGGQFAPPMTVFFERFFHHMSLQKSEMPKMQDRQVRIQEPKFTICGRMQAMEPM
jgi:hypothetical protein